MKIQSKTNQSVKRRKDEFKVRDRVLLKNMKRQSKFDPKYRSHIYMVIKIKDKGIQVKGTQGRVFIMHKDDVKRCHYNKGNEEVNQSNSKTTVENLSEMNNRIEVDRDEAVLEANRNEYTLQQYIALPNTELRRSTRNTHMPKKIC